MALCTATHWAFNLMLAKATPYMLVNLGYGTYFVFAACVSDRFSDQIWLIANDIVIPLHQR